MQDPEQPVNLERMEKLRNVLVVAAAYAVSALLYKLLFHEGFGHSSLLFVGLPGVLAILLALAPRAGTAKGGIVKGITLALLLIAPLLGEGYLCILMASPLFYLIGLLIGAAIDASRNKTNTLSCAAGLVILLSLDGIIPSHHRQETVSVTQWILWQSSSVKWQPVDATHTRVTWQTTFERDTRWICGPRNAATARSTTKGRVGAAPFRHGESAGFPSPPDRRRLCTLRQPALPVAEFARSSSSATPPASSSRTPNRSPPAPSVAFAMSHPTARRNRASWPLGAHSSI
jgi:hypothetical protein